MECTGHDPLLWSHGSSVSRRCTPRSSIGTWILEHELGTKCFVLGPLVNGGGWSSDRLETCIAQPAASPCRAQLKQNCSLWPLSHSFSLKFRCLKVNGFHVKEVGIYTEDLWERARTSEQEKQKSRWSFFQVSCASQARDLPLIPENIFTRRNG